MSSPLDAAKQVFPMYVGVIPKRHNYLVLWDCIPHVRGGDPMKNGNPAQGLLYSPCTWG